MFITFIVNEEQVIFQVLTAASMKMAVCWVVAPYNLVDVYRRFRGAYCLHRQGDLYKTTISQKPVILKKSDLVGEACLAGLYTHPTCSLLH
jgi:hypothetical protein